MAYFIRRGSTFTPTDSDDIRPGLPIGNYAVCEDQFKSLYLESIDPFSLPAKFYGTIVADSDRMFHTFQDRKASTGVLLVGEKGSGKTLLAKRLSALCADAGFPTIVVNRPFGGDGFNKLIQDIGQPALIMFDEFEKVYSREAEDQNAILTLLDGVYPTKKLFVLTSNDKWRINNHMWNRPGRLYYMMEFSGLTTSFVREYCEDNLANCAWLDHVIVTTQLFTEVNFDMLQAIVEETNRYDEDPRTLLRLLNLKTEFDGDAAYDVTLLVGGVEIPAACLITNVWRGNPTTVEEDESYISVYCNIPKEACRNTGIDVVTLRKLFAAIHAKTGRGVSCDSDDVDDLNGIPVARKEFMFRQEDLVEYMKGGSVRFVSQEFELILVRQNRARVRMDVFAEAPRNRKPTH